MKVKHVIESPEGQVELTAVLTDDELRLVIELGLNMLYAHGSFPFISKDDSRILAPGTVVVQ